jgi:creatinine amidohydrolase
LDASPLRSPTFGQEARDRVAVLPFGMVEEHGPHMSLDTDIRIAEALAEDAVEEADAPALRFPVQPHGTARSTRQLPGTLALSERTLEGLVADLVDELDRHGVPAALLLSAHASQSHMAVLHGVADDRDGEGMRLGATTPWARMMEAAGGGKLAAAPAWDGHAGTLETSWMLHLHPDRVDDDRPGADKWEPRDETGPGYRGDPSAATAEIGAEVHRLGVEAAAGLVEELADRARIA